ncbi:MAG: Peptidyl-tRNA hydrolase [Candidatus Uhrbacteria bacterium GW2011_GWA2_53_10]|uniref:Peptidyl-tRNA hydrolase n=1 Tax=Candidatus Uhrbacteria bacterium GW2011_GWA2_53_10 TaxID=1618980 RepID=A0A0G1XNZ1_9BACT|nr:MAG: Peptidyl-tRNA hydrolase [Candidatus Uhrbacteria bacterium GW2011_GWA2_53_10]
MKLIVGLGNPGKEYDHTRHNVGFLVLDRLAETAGGTWKGKKKWQSEISEIEIKDGVRVRLCKPQTFMNKSGDAVKALAQSEGVRAEDILVVYDEADFPFGKIAYRAEGSSAGHNGMQSILDQFPGAAIARVRVGIGRPENPLIPLEEWVLQRWSAEEAVRLPEIIDEAAKIVLGHI